MAPVTLQTLTAGVLIFGLGYTLGSMSKIGDDVIGSESSNCLRSASVETNKLTNDDESKSGDGSLIDKSVWDVNPLEHTRHVEFIKGCTTDAFNPFSNYLYHVNDGVPGRQATFPELPFFTTWPHYMEAYHNHMHRFRSLTAADPNHKVVFMEIGVQYGGKIPLLRDYFGPGLTYIGVDINSKTKVFEENADWVNIEIGDSSNRAFLRSLKEKYPHVDIFLDDGGHTMEQQRVAIEEMLPHVQPEGVYICEDLSTSWAPSFGGVINGDVDNAGFRDRTMVGYIHKTYDWLNANWISGGTKNPRPPRDGQYPPMWKVIHEQVKHIHLYDQLVVYEKGVPMVPRSTGSVGTWVFEPKLEGQVNGPVDWDLVLKKIQSFTKSPWKW